MNLAVYGAEEAGKSYVNHIVLNQNCKLVVWVDQKYEVINSYNGYKIHSPQDLLNSLIKY